MKINNIHDIILFQLIFFEVKILNHKKIILVGIISAFVALLTTWLGVTGTVIGSVISSMLYNMLSEALEKPVENASFSTNFEWEIAYIFPLIVISLIQLLLILAMLSEWGILPTHFLNLFLSIQNLTDNNLYKILGIGLLIISVYPLVLKPDFIKKYHGAIIAFVGLIFLARGFVDIDNAITDVYDGLFAHFDFPIAVLALILLVYVIIKILMSAREKNKESRIANHDLNNMNFSDKSSKKIHHSKKHDDFDYMKENSTNTRHNKINKQSDSLEGKDVHFKQNIDKHHTEEIIVDHSDDSVDLEDTENPSNNDSADLENAENSSNKDSGINKSSEHIHFESNDLLDDYKK